MILLDLLYNLSVLIALSVLSGFIDLRYRRTGLKGKIFQGLLFGITAIIGMLYPFHLTEGIIFDGRSIVISLSTLFFGPISGSIASVMAIIFRVHLGGGGTLTGSLVILSSFAIGYFFHTRRSKLTEVKHTNLYLYSFGVIVNFVMLLFFLLLPYADKLGMFEILVPTILGVYPFATLLIGKILLDQKENREFVSRLKESEERWQFALEGPGDGVWDWNANSNKVYFSPRWKKMLGYNDGDIGDTLSEWESRVHPDDKIYVMEEINRHFGGDVPVYRSEHRLRCKDGSYKWVLDRGKIMSFDSAGKPLRIIGTHTDISERKQFEESLKEQKAEFETIFKLVPAQIWYKDAKNNYIRVNRQVCEDIGLTREQIEGHSAGELFPSFAEQYYRDDKEIFRTREPKLGIIEQINTASGELRWLQTDKIPVFGKDGAPIGLISFVQDITERKQMIEELIKAKEKAEEMNRLKSIFLANMSHELRTPLIGINGYAELLQESLIEPVSRGMAENIFKSGLRLSETLNLILDYSKLEAEKTELKMDNFDLVDVTEEITRLFSEPARRKGLDLLACYSSKSIILKSDERAIRTILNNLINNAIKYTDKGSVKTSISHGEKLVEIKVQDSGIGIPKEEHELIFEEFRQASEGYNRHFEGTGLGLNITKKLVKKLKGNIYLESEPGKGTEFTVKIPVNNLPG